MKVRLFLLNLSTQVSEKYSSAPPDPSLPPHIYAVANRVYRDMMAETRPQCCVISGESGAGKTETCKLLVQQLLFLTESKAMDLSIKIEQVRPISMYMAKLLQISHHYELCVSTTHVPLTSDFMMGYMWVKG